MVPKMRSGLAGEVSDDPRMEQTMETVTALLRLFCKRSVEVAGSYALGNGRRVVTERDMRCSLQYVARTFFSAPDLESDVERELGAMAEEEGSEGEEGSQGEEGSEGSEGSPPSPRYRQLSRNVDLVVENWHLWNPEDPVECLIKRAVDKTSV